MIYDTSEKGGQIEAQSNIVEIASSIENIAAHMKQFQELKAKLLSPEDTCLIQGKPFVKRSGWRKFALAFNLTDTITQTEKDVFDGGFTWRIMVSVSAPNGRSVTAIGSCSSTERKFLHVEHDVYAIAHTRAKNRGISDLIGSGEVSAEEMGEDSSPSEATQIDSTLKKYTCFKCKADIKFNGKKMENSDGSPHYCNI